MSDDMELYDLRVTVDSIGGRPVCGLSVGDYFEVTESSRLRLPPGGHFCVYALAAVLPLLPALLEMARVTSRVRLGAACLNPYTQHPYEIAGGLAALDATCRGSAEGACAGRAWGR
jgi:uncharacterized repeat protein (TIGR04076 family)